MPVFLVNIVLMPRKPRIEYPGAIYHVMSRGDRREAIFLDDVDRQDFLKTLAEACVKAEFQIHAYCLMGNHFHLVVETPKGNLVEGMRWLLSSYTLRLNHRHKLFGHVFSGRYKSVLIDGASPGYLKVACDYVHLNPVRAKLLAPGERLLAYPWSSWGLYLVTPQHRPEWMRVDRLLGEHGLGADTAEARQELERRTEESRAAEEDGAQWAPLRRGWCLGSDDFKRQALARMEGQLGEYHAGDLRRESSEAKAERIIAEELEGFGWAEADLEKRHKSDPGKLALAARLRRETTLPVKWITTRLGMGTWKSASTRLQTWKKAHESKENSRQMAML
jgi:putative transposase